MGRELSWGEILSVSGTELHQFWPIKLCSTIQVIPDHQSQCELRPLNPETHNFCVRAAMVAHWKQTKGETVVFCFFSQRRLHKIVFSRNKTVASFIKADELKKLSDGALTRRGGRGVTSSEPQTKGGSE